MPAPSLVPPEAPGTASWMFVGCSPFLIVSCQAPKGTNWILGSMIEGYSDLVLGLCMGLITKNKWKQHCGARKSALGFRRGSGMPGNTRERREKSHRAGGEHHRNVTGALHHQQQVGTASVPA